LGLSVWIRDLPFVAALIAIAFIDLEHRIIPDELSLGGLVWGLVTSFWDPELTVFGAVSGAAVGFGFFYGFSWLYFKVTGRVGLGGGDVKLMAMLGAFIGFWGVMATMLVSSIAGSVVGIGWAIVSRQKKVLMTSIPYGPFLVLGALYYFWWGAPWLDLASPASRLPGTRATTSRTVCGVATRAGVPMTAASATTTTSATTAVVCRCCSRCSLSPRSLPARGAAPPRTTVCVSARTWGGALQLAAEQRLYARP
jgi:Flp pilus assembly protein protease CpaA